ncbi:MULTISPECIES: ATP-binding protein [unclassified Spirillospora]|uniref:sensor histidine kinase n=1 Tax=unclassified Spirillospora TaxID=2642701 RepID=UPI00371F9829
MSRQTRLLLAMAVVGAAITLGAAVAAAEAATRRVHQQRTRSAVHLQRRLGELGFLVARGRRDLQRLAEGLSTGEKAAPCSEDLPVPDTGDAVMLLTYELQRAQAAAWNAMLDVASREPAGDVGQRVGVYVNLARRMQSLSHRAIQGLDALENQVEDPDLLKGLFKVDHLNTRLRRQAESLAVLGGTPSRRQWTKPVTVYEVLRSAIAEVEHYHRVKVVPPIDGNLHGGAVADVVHLLAELIENATKFSPPETQVLIRVENVSAGLAIEVEDRGLGIPRGDQRRLNALLAEPERADPDELLKDGRIGLLVVSALARRHKTRVQLQGNVYGGTQAIVVVPKELDGSDAEEAEVRSQTKAVTPRPAPPQAVLSASVPAAASPSQPASLPGFEEGVEARPSLTFSDPHVLDARLPDPPVPAHDERPATPAQPSGSPAGVPDSGTGPGLPGAPGERPRLPQRQAQTHLVPELATAPALQEEEQEIEPNPRLMAAFQKGLRSAQENDAAADGPDGPN